MALYKSVYYYYYYYQWPLQASGIAYTVGVGGNGVHGVGV